MHMAPLPAVAVLAPYWSFWEQTAAGDFRRDRQGLLDEAVRRLAGAVEVVAAALLDSREEATRLAAHLLERRVQAVLVLQSMAVPPAYALACLDALPGVPLVVWAAHRTGLVPGDFDHGAITVEGATVGTPMLTNCLVRRGRPFELILGRLEDAACLERVRQAVRVAAVAGGLRGARLGRVGRPIDGYECVDADPAALQAAMGMEVVPIEPGELLARWREVQADTLRDLVQEVDAVWERQPGIEEGEALERSLRAAAALDRLVEDYRLDAGAMNCHVREIRFGREIGITPCYGLGRLTSRGIPWTCTGDIVTAVAMLTVKRLGGAAIYHELEAVDYATGEVVIANSGEHDLDWCAPGERPRLRRNGWFDGHDPRCGVCGCFEAAPGPATLVGFTPHPTAAGGFRYIVAPGAITARRFPQTGTVNGAFRFASGPVEEAWRRWALAGSNHHSCATPGDYAGAVEAVAKHRGIEAVRV